MNKNKGMEISLLLSCQASFRLYALRSNVCSENLGTLRCKTNSNAIPYSTWLDDDNRVKWIEKAFPDEVEELLLNEEEEEVYEDDEESEKENESDWPRS